MKIQDQKYFSGDHNALVLSNASFFLHSIALVEFFYIAFGGGDGILLTSLGGRVTIFNLLLLFFTPLS